MSNLDEIELTVTELQPDQLAQFRDWFARFDAENWDAQIEQNVAEGKLDALAQQAIEHHSAGRTQRL
jgi:hypothetical protein